MLKTDSEATCKNKFVSGYLPTKIFQTQNISVEIASLLRCAKKQKQNSLHTYWVFFWLSR